MSIKGMGYQITSSDGEITRRSIIGADDKKSSAKYVSKASGMNEVTANSYGGNSSRSNSGTQVSGIQGFFQKPLMEGVLPDSKKVIRQMCRDAFRYDPVAGPMVELLSILPWSGITLTGIKDSSVLEKYTTSITNMNLMNLMPELTVDYLVNGAFVAQNIFDSSNGVFTGISPQSIDACDITPVPIYGVDPLINLRFSDEFKRLLDASKTDSRAKAIVDDLGASFQNDLKRGVMQLDPEVTTYIPRRTFASELYGTSYLQRIIPYWIIEKALLRGTIELSYRRQKSILHLILGDEDWEATEEDMRATVQKWLDADQDPTGAIIATRPGVVPTEVRCVAGNTLISTDKGVRRIDSLFDHDVNGKPFSMNTNVRVKGIDGKLHGVAEWHFHGIKPTLNIKTSSGSEITATKNHKFLVVKDGGKLEFVTADKLDGQLVCLEEKGEHKSAKQLALNVKKPSVIERSDNQDIILPKVMTPDGLRYRFDRVVSVKEGKARPVYDLTMKEGQAPVYVANGIVTHNSGSDFWRIDEIQSFTTDVKFRALGGNESLLSGDINLNTMDNAMSTFLERLRYMRNVITYRLFSQRIFPHIAVKNGFRAKSNTMRHEITGKDSVHLGTDSNLFTLFSGAGVFENGLAKGVYSETFNPSEYSIPKVNWIKHLKPEADSAYMEILEKLEEKGLPIPLRIWSAAAGVNVAEVMYGYEDDLKIRRRAAAHAKQIPKTKSNDEEGGGSFAEAIAEAMAVKEPKSRKAIIRALSSKFGRKHPHLAAASANKLRPMGLDRFNSQEINESMRDPDTGRTLSRKGRRVMVERVHKVAAEAASRIAQRENYKMKSK